MYAAQAVMLVYIQSLGLTQNHLSLAQAVFVVTIFVASIPSGWIADRYSRPLCLVVSNGITAAGFVWYMGVTTLTGVLVAEVLLGIGGALSFGASSSLTAAYAELENRLVGKTYSRLTAASTAVGAIVIALGGWIGAYSPRAALGLSAGLFVAAMILSLVLKEPRPRRASEVSISSSVLGALREMGKGIRYALHENNRLKWVIIAMCTGTQIGRGLLWVQSTLYLMSGMSAAWVGLAWILYIGPAAFGSYVLEHFVERWSRIKLFLAPALVSLGAMAVLAIAVTPWTIGMFVIIGLTAGWCSALFRVLIQREGDDDELSFTKSVGQCVNIVIYVVVTFVVGWVASRFGAQAAIVANISMFLPIVLLCGWKLSRPRKQVV